MTPTAFSIHPTPVGDALLVFTSDGLVTLQVLHEPLGSALERVALELRALPEHDDERGADVAAQLDEYFEGARHSFEIPLDWRLARGFTQAALRAACDIPYGETASYGEVAVRAGSPGAARAVGTACAHSPFSLVVPVHRVVRADGSLGEYGGHPEVKRFLIDLESEGVPAAGV
ncbi:MAG: methylated-DNA--[protein]-cysteine S-methyltransferase [Actinobacteria bacterium]|nr:methylated-DNA--[protein]-cysteine S-methyltransferase [Actinomycetota bacterium]